MIYWFALTLIKLSNTFPRIWVLKFSGFLGSMAFHLFKEAREVALKNLTDVFGHQKAAAEIQKLARKVFWMIGANAADIMRAVPIESLDELKRFVKIEGEEYLKAAIDKGNGVIMISAHLGAFELVGSFLGLAGYRPIALGTALKDEKLNSMLRKQRASKGGEAVQRGKETFRLFKALKSGRLVGMLIDQDTRVKSRFVNFMGRPAATPIGPTLMALKTGAAVVPIYISLQTDFTQLLRVNPEVTIECTGDEEKDLIQNTQRISDTTEKAILENPEQWVWMHERWKTRPGEEIR